MGPFSQSWARIWRLIKRSATRINLMWKIPERRTCSTPPSSSLRARARADASIPIRYFEEAAKLRPKEPEPHRGMAEIYRLTGRPAQATAEQEEADHLDKRLGKLN